MYSACISYICALSYIIILASNHEARERRLLQDADWFVSVVFDINRYIVTSLVEKRQQCDNKLITCNRQYKTSRLQFLQVRSQ